MPLNVFNKNNLNTKQVVEVKPVPSNRVGAAKKQVMEIASKNEEPSTPRNVFEDNTPNKRAGLLAKPAP